MKQYAKRPDIPRPSAEQVELYLEKWNQLEKCTAQESALNKLFRDMPTNDSLDVILLKIATLNEFYFAHVWDILKVAQYIYTLHVEESLDARLKAGDATLVDAIAKSGGKVHMFSFATKYCSFHEPEKYPIYDIHVVEMLMYFRDVDEFTEFEEFKDYSDFKRVVLEMRSYYGLGSFSLKQIDRYLWQLGKEKFPIEEKV